jgi:hypothetical protein
MSMRAALRNAFKTDPQMTQISQISAHRMKISHKLPL